MIQKIIREPLVHFLFAGFLLFLFFDKCASNAYSEDNYTIVVNKEALLTLMQYRSKAFQGDFFEQKFDKLNKTERQQLIKDYVQEEALFREAQQLNLADNDYIIKRRMIQKIDFIYQNKIEENLSFPEDSLLLFFKNNKTQYQTLDLYTFSHIFFKTEKGDFPATLSKANTFLKKTNMAAIDFNQSLQYGERFLYHRHYVEKDLSFIDSHFGGEFAEAMATLTADESKWYGPFKSKHGYHLVLLMNKTAAEIPDFEQLKTAVTADYKRVFEKRLKENLMQEVIGRYEVKIDF